MKQFASIFLFAILTLTLRGEAPALPWLKLDANGQFKIGPVTSGLLLQTRGFQQTACESAINCRFKEHPGTPELDTTIYLDEFTPFKDWKPVSVEKRLTVHGSNSANWRYTLHFSEEHELARLALTLKLPEEDFKGETLLLDGKPLALPDKYEKVHLFTGKARELQLPLAGGTLRLSGNLAVIIQDQRIWNLKSYSVILLFSPADGTFPDSTLELDLAYLPTRLSAKELRDPKWKYTTLDLSGVANNSTSDRIAGDGKGGWTDQGGENDLSCFTPQGEQRFKEIPFQIAPPPRNVVTVGGRNWKQFPQQLTIPVGDRRAAGLYFLHTSAWTSPVVGRYTVTYTDGSTITIPIRNLGEIFNWIDTGISEHAIPGWSGKNATQGVQLTLFSWPNPHPGKGIHSIQMQADDNPQVFFALLGITLAAQYPYLIDETPETTADVSDAGWTRLAAIDEKTADGSAIDVSARIPAPAGQFGFVRVDGEGFAFENGRKARFLGVNFDYGNCFPGREEIVFHAKRLRRLGVNAVRFHKYDLLRGEGRSLFLKDPNSGEFDRENLDRMFFAMNELKKNGLYWCMDLLTSRQVKPCEFPEFAGEAYYIHSIFMPRLIELQKEFITKLLTTRNPYTGKTLAEDPALALLIVQNEDSLLYQPNRNRIKHPLALAELKRRFNEYLRGKYPTRAALAAAWNNTLSAAEDLARDSVELPMNPAGFNFSEARQADMRLFYYETQRNYYRTIRDHVRSLGIRAPLAGSNHWTSDPLDLRANAELDFVDRHNYWAHPTVVDGWAFHQVLFNPLPTVKSPTGGLVGNLAARRVAGKPYAVTEWNVGSTNEFRADAQLTFPAYAAMHDWQLFQFSYSPVGTSGQFARPMVYSFGMNDDPVQLSLLPISAILFHRGDTAGGRRQFQMVSDRELADPGFALDREAIELAALQGKSGIAFENISQPAEQNAPSGLKWNARTGRCEIDTPRTQGFAGFPGGEAVVCGTAQFLLNGDFAVVALTSLDDLPLQTSNRMLLSAVARGWNQGMKFNTLRNRITELGMLPRVMQPVTGTLKLARSARGLTVHALDYSGRPLSAPAIREEKGAAVIELTGAPHYELIFKE